MEIAITHKIEKVGYGRQRPSNKGRKWLALSAWLFLIWVFMFILAPWMQKSQAVKPLADFIEEREIDASALYYTEVEEASVAELNIRSGIEYRPVGP